MASGVEEGEGVLAFEREHALTLHARDIGLAEARSHGRPLFPDTPSDGAGGQAERVSMLGESIEEGIGGRIIGLAGIAGDARDGREEDEGGKVEVTSELVQVPSRVELGGKDA